MSQQAEFDYEAEQNRRDTLLSRLEGYFLAHPNTEIDGRALHPIAGSYAWRSRLAELRTKRNLDIENRQTRVGRKVTSTYTLHMPARQNVTTRKGKNQYTKSAA